MKQIEMLMEISNLGIHFAVGRPELLRFIDTLEAPAAVAESGENRSGYIPDEEAEETAARIRGAEESISSIMLEHALMGLWSKLEASIEDLAALWLAINPDALTRTEVARIRIPLAEYLALAEEDRPVLLVSELQRDLRTSLAEGVTPFERLLSAVGLGGALDPWVRKSIFEISRVRDLIAHRGGVVDRKFAEACPWLGGSPGERFSIVDRYGRYADALSIYALTLVNRCRIAHGHPAIAEDTLATAREMHEDDEREAGAQPQAVPPPMVLFKGRAAGAPGRP